MVRTPQQLHEMGHSAGVHHSLQDYYVCEQVKSMISSPKIFIRVFFLGHPVLMSEITCLLPIEKRITPTIIDNTPNSFKAVLDSSLLVDGCSLLFNGLPRLS